MQYYFRCTKPSSHLRLAKLSHGMDSPPPFPFRPTFHASSSANPRSVLCFYDSVVSFGLAGCFDFLTSHIPYPHGLASSVNTL